ncbi:MULTISPECIES: 1-phosphofructokinase [Aerococcus]|uniref:Tagatose-6-phosphate kinase n=1 Tax=Aerococcus sanguinicola TaxID=119206 RepID=A0A5N1GII1_9LACT|nr:MULTISPECIES: 1-phosphofructokinase [Aerococcus]KAA9300146.1 1-phosphofructokinase [Aerococcus sanguinicola]MDK6369488.1 1-phosphofructokinase [Aerococcus sp. UMB9870]MDK6679975.1 1-phosphofructokinase [Aerococcus sp. UMB8608]MDK6686143.1 1-phosphofructokinase [Aerococcus sp. UMB8623]MDK6939923.1 1-phosphofructokinase [Aerococcus sp. UMB8487]
MFYTCTLNPAIDLFIDTDKLLPNTVNRTNNYDVIANGKGVNVSLILKKLGIDSCALSIGGGFTFNYIQDYLHEQNIETYFIKTEGTTRINVFTRVRASDLEYKLVNPGPCVTTEIFNTLMDKIYSLTSDDCLIVSGSFAKGIDPEQLIRLAELSAVQGFKIVIDTSYDTIMDCLQYKPLLIKPNEDEIKKWFKLNDEDKLTLEDYIHYGKLLINKGAQNILLSLGSQGALFINKDSVLYGNAPKGQVVNTACSGDTMLGTFIAYRHHGSSYEEALKYSLAAGSSTAFTTALTDFTDTDDLSEEITIKRIEGD